MEREQMQQRALDDGGIDANKYDSSTIYWADVAEWYANQIESLESTNFRLADDALESANEVEALQTKLDTLQRQLKTLAEHSATFASQRNDALSRLDSLTKGITDWLEGNFDHPRTYRGKGGKCPHGTWYYEDCNACDTAHFDSVLFSGSEQWRYSGVVAYMPHSNAADPEPTPYIPRGKE